MAMTFTYETLGEVKKIAASWTSNGSGAASGTTKKIVGELLKGITDPTDGPTDNYDITLSDEQSFDVLTNCADNLTNRHTTTTQEVYLLVNDSAATDPGGVVHPCVSDKLTIAVANAGDTKSGVLYLYVRGIIHGTT